MKCEVGGLEFDSDFDSGNLGAVEIDGASLSCAVPRHSNHLGPVCFQINKNRGSPAILLLLHPHPHDPTSPRACAARVSPQMPSSPAATFSPTAPCSLICRPKVAEIGGPIPIMLNSRSPLLLRAPPHLLVALSAALRPLPRVRAVAVGRIVRGGLEPLPGVQGWASGGILRRANVGASISHQAARLEVHQAGESLNTFHHGK